MFMNQKSFVKPQNKLKVDEMPIKCVYGDEKSYVHFRHVIHYVMFTFRLLLCKLLGGSEI